MAADDFYAALQARQQELRLRLGAQVGAGDPEMGSDAWLMVEALCGAPTERYLPAFAASGRLLAEQGGRLEVRLAGIETWQRALAEAVTALLADEPRLLAAAQAFLGTLVARVVVTLAEAYQSVRLRQTTDLSERARRGISRLDALQRINAAANSTLDLDQTLATAAKAVAAEMAADLCSIYLFDDVSRELQLRATSGPYPRTGRHSTLKLGQGYSGWVAEHGHPLIITDALADPRFDQEAGAYATPYRGLLSVPIIFFTVLQLQGVISVQSHEPHYFSEDEVAFLEIVAGQLAMNIENGKIHEQTDEELRRKVHELSTLHRVSALVTSTLVLDNVLRMIASQAVQLTGADRSVLFALDPATQRLRAVASHGFDSTAVMAASAPVGRCCAGRVVRTGEPSMQIDCMRTDEDCFLHGRSDAIDDQHAVLCAPLVTGHGALGALCVMSNQRHMLSAHQLQLVVTFANVAAIAMENAQLFEQTREGLRTKEALLREMHHRVKNNLQQVASILNMQRRRARLPEVEQILIESVDRIQGIAATHDLLSSTVLGVAPVDEIARKIVGIVQGNLVPPHLHLRFVIGSAPFPVPSEQATTLAIVLNELIANAIEHGFGGRKYGEIRISGALRDGQVLVRVADDGVGLPAGFSLQSAEGLGLQLVRRLAQSDLKGSVEISRWAGSPDFEQTEAPTGARPPDPASPATSDEAAADMGHAWTVAEVRFPLPVVAVVEEQWPAVVSAESAS